MSEIVTPTHKELQLVLDEVVLQVYADTISALDLSRDGGLGDVEDQQRAQHALLRVSPWKNIIDKSLAIYERWAKGEPYSLPRACQASLEPVLDLPALQFFAGCSENNYPRNVPTPWCLREACFADVLIPNPESRWFKVWMRHQQCSTQTLLFKNTFCDIWGPTPHCTSDCQSCQMRDIFFGGSQFD